MATLIGAAPSKARATEACRAKQRCVRETLLGGDIACVWWEKQVMTVVKKDKERPARERGSVEQGAPEHTHCSSPQQYVVLR